MTRGKPLLTDEQWKLLEPFLPVAEPQAQGGRPRADNRRVLEGILWILWTGSPWRALPQEYPSPSTCWRRLRDWIEDGTWDRIWGAFVEMLEDRQQIDWSECFADATFAPAKKGALESGSPRRAKAQSFWWWRTARVFLSRATYARLPQERPRSSKKRSSN